MSQKKNILVTGGAGYIGSHTVVALIENGFHPVIVDDFRNSERDVIDRLTKITGEEISYYSIDICDKELLRTSLAGIQYDGVIHFAAYKAVGESVNLPLKYYQNNIIGIVNILEWCQENKVDNFVFSSSCTVYGQPKNGFVVDESVEIVKSNSPYGTTKIMGEQILQDVHQSNVDLKTMCLRYFNPVGAHPSGLIGELPIGKPTNLLPFVTQTGIGIQDELVIFGNDYPTEDGTCLRDFIHVSDLANAHVSALNYLMAQDKSLIEFVNIGTGKGSSMMEVIETFERVSGVKLNWRFGERRKGDVVAIFANAEKALQLLNWKAQFTLEDAIRDAWNWEQKRSHAL